ncbi:MAG: hypothetical protein BWY08_00746 [Bacteroidetes bacterium ADurb.Bin174]|nr:MAG: hypothetical protein BWY08_00746 [Bacteroidetes bacterium ADurb.Bin174]
MKKVTPIRLNQKYDLMNIEYLKSIKIIKLRRSEVYEVIY